MAQSDEDEDGLDSVLMGYLIAAINIAVVLLPFIEIDGLWDGLMQVPRCAVAATGAILCLWRKKPESKSAETDFDRVCSDDQIGIIRLQSPWQAAYCAHLQKQMTKLYERLDRDGSGLISRDELLKAVEDTPSAGHVSEIFQYMDADRSGQISRDEFFAYFGVRQAGGERLISVDMKNAICGGDQNGRSALFQHSDRVDSRPKSLSEAILKSENITFNAGLGFVDQNASGGHVSPSPSCSPLYAQL